MQNGGECEMAEGGRATDIAEAKIVDRTAIDRFEGDRLSGKPIGEAAQEDILVQTTVNRERAWIGGRYNHARAALTDVATGGDAQSTVVKTDGAVHSYI